MLLEERYLGERPGTTVLISKRAGTYEISFILVYGAWNDAAIVDIYRELGEMLADARFGRPLIIGLCDEYTDLHKEIFID